MPGRRLPVNFATLLVATNADIPIHVSICRATGDHNCVQIVGVRETKEGFVWH